MVSETLTKEASMEAIYVVLAVMQEGKLLFIRHGNSGPWMLPFALHVEENDPSVTARKLLKLQFPHFAPRRSAAFKGRIQNERGRSAVPVFVFELNEEGVVSSVHPDIDLLPVYVLVTNGEGDLTDTHMPPWHFESRLFSFEEYEHECAQKKVLVSSCHVVDALHKVRQLNPHEIEVTIF